MGWAQGARRRQRDQSTIFSGDVRLASQEEEQRTNTRRRRRPEHRGSYEAARSLPQVDSIR